MAEEKEELELRSNAVRLDFCHPNTMATYGSKLEVPTLSAHFQLISVHFKTKKSIPFRFFFGHCWFFNLSKDSFYLVINSRRENLIEILNLREASSESFRLNNFLDSTPKEAREGEELGFKICLKFALQIQETYVITILKFLIEQFEAFCKRDLIIWP